MKRLTAYLARLFVTDAILLFGVVSLLIWLVNCLRSFDVVSVKGQGLLTLAFQAFLTMPPLMLTFYYVCVGIGLARALQALQASRELHIIHTSNGLGSLFRASGFVAAAAVAGVLLLSNFLEPYANRRLNVLSASIAADLIGTTLQPQRFTEVTSGVVLLIGSRSGDGEISEFFADDRRDPTTRRTYIAETAQVSSYGDAYIVELRNGSLQYTESDGRFSQISFARYDLSVDQLSQPMGAPDAVKQADSVELVTAALAEGSWDPYVVRVLIERLSEGLRVIGICILVLAMGGFPGGSRSRSGMPMEVTVMLLAFTELGISSYSPLGPSTGALLMTGIGLAIIAVRVWPRPIRYEASA